MLFLWAGVSQAGDPPSVLIVAAHPDDEYYMAATTVRIARDLGGRVDQVVITNGEAGFKYSGPAEKFYGKELVREEAGRRELPRVREKELEASGRVLGIREHELLGQKDFGYTKDSSEALARWDKKKILGALKHRLTARHYDFVMGVLPTSVEHGHHKAATLLALEAVHSLPEVERPLVLGAFDSADTIHDAGQEAAIAAARSYAGIDRFPLSKPVAGTPIFRFDRRRRLGSQKQLSYHVWVNWMIAEHKSQGLFQTMVGHDDYENFVLLGEPGLTGATRTQALFAAINAP